MQKPGAKEPDCIAPTGEQKDGEACTSDVQCLSATCAIAGDTGTCVANCKGGIPCTDGFQCYVINDSKLGCLKPLDDRLRGETVEVDA